MDNESTLHISIVFAICKPNIIKLDWDLMKFWQKQVGSFWHALYWINQSNQILAVPDSTRIRATVFVNCINDASIFNGLVVNSCGSWINVDLYKIAIKYREDENLANNIAILAIVHQT